MPISSKYLAIYHPSEFYHIYNRTNNKELLFLNDGNRQFFLNKIQAYMNPMIDLFAWSLLPNHFHLLAKIKKEHKIRNNLTGIKKISEYTLTECRFLSGEITVHKLITDTFKRCFQSYSQAFNKATERNGNLLYTPYKHVHVTDLQYLRQVVTYIHQNPEQHGVTDDFRTYQWSSWKRNAISPAANPVILELHQLFGGYQSFIEWHNKQDNLIVIPDQV